MGNLASMVNQYVNSVDNSLKKIVAQDSTNPEKITYICLAMDGTPINSDGWRIVRINSVSTTTPTLDVFEFPRLNPTIPQTESSDMKFNPTLRETYTYGAE